jgi:hypothetical protein
MVIHWWVALREALPVELDPQATLVEWRVLELPGGSRHLTGWNIVGKSWRISSAIQRLDPITGTCATSSGRCYGLQGAPGTACEAGLVWESFAAHLRVEEARDVSNEVWELICSARSPEARS